MSRLCPRCGVNVGTVKWGDLLALTHGGGEVRCERCVVEVQLAHALERAALIPELQKRLAELGGPAAREVCGYVGWKREDDTTPFGTLCLRDKGHDGYHSAGAAQ